VGTVAYDYIQRTKLASLSSRQVLTDVTDAVHGAANPSAENMKGNLNALDKVVII